MHHILLIRSSVGHLGCFYVLAVVNNTMNMGVQISLQNLQDPAFNSLDIYPEVELLDHAAVLFLIF